MPGGSSPLTISHLEAAEIRELLPTVDASRRADQHMARARLRRIGYPLGDAPSDADFNALIESGEVVVDETGRARIQPKSGRIFRCSVGVTGHPVDSTWSAFNQRFQWFGDAPQSISSGDHLFIFAVDTWRSGSSGYSKPCPPARRGCRTPPMSNVGHGRSEFDRSQPSHRHRRSRCPASRDRATRHRCMYMTRKRGRSCTRQWPTAHRHRDPKRSSSVSRKSNGRISATTSSRRSSSWEPGRCGPTCLRERSRSANGPRRSLRHGPGTRAGTSHRTSRRRSARRSAWSRT
jgi:hypothetical protein